MVANKKPSGSKLKVKLREQHEIRGTSKAFNRLLKVCDDLKAEDDSIALISKGSDFVVDSEDVYDAIKTFQAKISNVPFLALVISWASEIDSRLALGERYASCLVDLIDHKTLPVESNKNHKLVTLSELHFSDHSEVFDAIRSNSEWSIDRREDYVNIYHEFTNWLSEATFGLIQRPHDPDRSATSNRRLPYETFTRILKELSLRERILAKIFYLGGSRSLEDVLSLKIEDIDFKKRCLKISDESLLLPQHVMNDLNEYIGKRRKGHVFTNKNGDRIDPTVPYRALKTVISKLKLDPSFAFKDFFNTL